MSMFVLTGDQARFAGSLLASTTTGMFVAQEMIKPNLFVWTPKLERKSKITGFGNAHCAVGKPL